MDSRCGLTTMRRSIRIAACAFVALANHAHAVDFSISAGASATVGVRWAPAAFFDATGEVYDWHGLQLQPAATLGWIGSRNDRGDHLDHDVFIGGVGGRLVFWQNAFVGVEIAGTSATTDAISSHAEFIDSFGWQNDHVVLMVRHVSNANLFGGRNLGDTMVLAGVRF